jgi:hypothetical protein
LDDPTATFDPAMAANRLKVCVPLQCGQDGVSFSSGMITADNLFFESAIKGYSAYCPSFEEDEARWVDLVREEGFEPPRACARQLLRLLRLPVPPFPPETILPR